MRTFPHFQPCAAFLRAARNAPFLFVLVGMLSLIVEARAMSGDPPASCGNPAHSCFDVALDQTGCANVDCCQIVCKFEPACCDIAWDELCVALAVKFCSPCGTSINSCFGNHTTQGCEQSNCCSYVCSMPDFSYCCVLAWDAACAEIAETACQGCGAPGAGPCRVVHEGSGCIDAACCDLVCNVDPICCAANWDEICVQWAAIFCPGCGDASAGNCCVAHVTPYCDDADCCELVCSIDSFCCDVRWDVVCVVAASTFCTLDFCPCGDPAAGACKTVHTTPGCNDVECCAQVCLFDTYCCTIAWDTACTLAADVLCAEIMICGDVGTGSCFVAHATPACDDAGCCQAVCSVDPVCCTFSWDQTCAALATEICSDCGDIDAGSCFNAHGSPACSNQNCCEAVCNTDPFCCENEWDGVCVTFAQALCDSPIDACGSNLSRSCFIPTAYLPGCEDAGCCVLVCSTVDPFCCEVQWDAVCVEHAFTLCGGLAECPGRGSCLFANEFPGCNDAICCSAVCELDLLCCTLGWDQHCADFAKAICYGQTACPGELPCNQSHGSPGCEDPACCNIVCTIDPLCCIQKWDVNCVAFANARCQPKPESNCPCIGSCFEIHANPGCDNAACCAGTCSIDPACCVTGWDASCTSIARLICCGEIGCGNWCSGSCLEGHAQPFCDDAACCSAVCDVDPFCCVSAWDGFCVNLAELRCSSLCGLSGSGSCFVPHATPTCEDYECCNLVCAVDPICCTQIWDAACVTLAAGKRGRRGLCEEPQCGGIFAESCCNPHDGPTCNDAACCEAICDRDPFCCDVAWDESCAGAARSNSICNCVSDCGDPCAGSCCEPHEGPLCDDENCCEAVCTIDPFCCELAGGAWDQICVGIAQSVAQCDDPCPLPGCGDPDAGDCCLPHITPACSDKSCCEMICNSDPFCCDSQWDITCAANAGLDCPICENEIFCGARSAGSCFKEHATPFCDSLGCCSLICVIDETCCEVSWDASCVKLALGFCGG